MEIDYRKIGIRIKAARESKKLTQEELAELTGLTNNYISNIERTRSKPSIENTYKNMQCIRSNSRLYTAGFSLCLKGI